MLQIYNHIKSTYNLFLDCPYHLCFHHEGSNYVVTFFVRFEGLPGPECQFDKPYCLQKDFDRLEKPTISREYCSVIKTDINHSHTEMIIPETHLGTMVFIKCNYSYMSENSIICNSFEEFISLFPQLKNTRFRDDISLADTEQQYFIRKLYPVIEPNLFDESDIQNEYLHDESDNLHDEVVVNEFDVDTQYEYKPPQVYKHNNPNTIDNNTVILDKYRRLDDHKSIYNLPYLRYKSDLGIHIIEDNLEFNRILNLVKIPFTNVFRRASPHGHFMSSDVAENPSITYWKIDWDLPIKSELRSRSWLHP